jgi:hypothetical protein
MKKVILCPLLFLLIAGPIFPSMKPKPFSLPIRLVKNIQRSAGLNKNDIELWVNGVQRTVTRLEKRERSLSQVPDLGRHIILSFHNTKVTKPLQNALSYFFTEILDPKDSLILLSPIKAYSVPVSRDKEKMIMDVMDILHKDWNVHEKNKISAEKNLETTIQRLERIASSQPGNPSYQDPENSEQVLAQTTALATNYKAIYQVLLNFPQNFTLFKNRFLLPDIIKHREVKKILDKKHGEKWWIHFQNREDIQIIHKARSAGRKLNAYIATHESGELARTMGNSLANLQKQLLISESLPQAEILDTLHHKNMCYNAILWGSLKSSTSSKETTDLEAALRRIAELSGGKTTVATDPEQGIKEITQHADTFYELNFDFNGKVEDKTIQISAGHADLKFSHKQHFTKEEVEEWIRTGHEKKVQIRDFSLQNRTIHFEIDSFMQDQDKRFGILKVRISLFDRDNTHVYKSENTLRASKDKVSISVPLPLQHRGEFRLRAEVFDLLANLSASMERPVVLD